MFYLKAKLNSMTIHYILKLVQNGWYDGTSVVKGLIVQSESQNKVLFVPSH